MKLLPEEARFQAAGILGYGLVRTLFSTVRFERESSERLLRLRRRAEPVVLVCWHDQLLPLVHAHRGEGIVALVSEHADGEYIGRVLERYGFGTARGSSTRGGARGLRKLLHAARSGKDLAVTPDGPRGPRHRFKEGALVAAQLSGLPVVPLAGAASSAWRFDSWDRFMLPRPFSRVRLVYGRPVTITRQAKRNDRRRLARGLEATLKELTLRAAEAVEGDEARVRGQPRKARSRPEGSPAPGASSTSSLGAETGRISEGSDGAGERGREEGRAPKP